MCSLDLTFREANSQDINDIIEINNHYFISPKKNGKENISHGFLITREGKDKVLRDIKNSRNSYYIAQSHNREIVGFIKICDSVSNSVINKLAWRSPAEKKILEEGNTLYIEKIAIKNTCKRNKIGSFLYNSVFGIYPQIIFYSFVVKKPHINQSSLYFHQALGFVEVAIFRSANFLGIKNYESILMMRFVS
jgi:L-amino acid N-acyltransferase YncA